MMNGAKRQLIENKGALIRDHQSRELKKDKKEILTGKSVPLDLPANGRPAARWSLTLSFGPTL
jgi:hypothetical protein